MWAPDWQMEEMQVELPNLKVIWFTPQPALQGPQQYLEELDDCTLPTLVLMNEPCTVISRPENFSRFMHDHRHVLPVMIYLMCLLD